MKKILLGIVSLLLIMSVGYCEERSLQLTIKSDKQVYELGESINIKVIMKNTSDKEVIVWHAGFWANHRIILVDSNNQRVKLTEFGESCEKVSNQPGRDKNVRWPLKPNQEDIYEFVLNKIYLIQSPGIYYLTVTYEENWQDGWQGTLTSNTINIEVVENKTGISKEKAIEIAKEYAVKQGYDLKVYQKPTTTFDETNKAWDIFFETIDPIPGGHFTVIINDKTGEVLDFWRGK